MELGLANVPAIKRRPITFAIPSTTGAALNSWPVQSVIPIGYEGNQWVWTTADSPPWSQAYVARNNIEWLTSVRLSPGDLLSVTGISASTFNTTKNFGIAIDSLFVQWAITTCTDPALSFANVTSAAFSTVYTTNSIMHSDSTQDVTVVGGTVSNDNSTYGPNASVAPGAMVWVRQTSSSNPNTKTSANVTCGGVMTEWAVTTLAATAANLVFAAVPSATANTLYSTNSISKSNMALNMVLTGTGQISNNNSTWGANNIVASNGTVYVRMTSSPTANAALTATVTAAGVGYNWVVTTAPAVSGPPNLVYQDHSGAPGNIEYIGNSQNQGGTYHFTVTCISGTGTCEISNNFTTWVNGSVGVDAVHNDYIYIRASYSSTAGAIFTYDVATTTGGYHYYFNMNAQTGGDGGGTGG